MFSFDSDRVGPQADLSDRFVDLCHIVAFVTMWLKHFDL